MTASWKDSGKNMGSESPSSNRFPLLSKVLAGVELPLLDVLDEQAPTRNMPAPPDRPTESEEDRCR